MNRGFAKERAVSVRTAGAAFFFGAGMMKNMIAIAVLVGAIACAAKAPLYDPPTNRNLDGVMHLIGRYGYGHACPCDGLILTAAHVAHPLYLRLGYQDEPIGYTWSDERGGEGYLISDYLYLTKDLGIMRLESGTPAFYKHSQDAPQIGETLRWIEYDFSSAKKAFAPIDRKGELLRQLAGHLVLDQMPVAGASGACVFNAAGEVVAIVSWGHRIGAAVVVSVYGQWWPGGN